MIRIAIVEDEQIYVQQLSEYIDRYQQETGRYINVAVFSDGEEIVEDYRGEYDIILMDIQMRFMDGMTAAEKIRTLDHEVIIMFITNMIQYAVRGYEVDAIDYVVKPVEYFAFSQKLDKAIGRMKNQHQEYITVSTEDGLKKVIISDIYYIESQGHNAVYRTIRGDLVSRITMKELEHTMGKYGFFRCAKGYLVNMKLVEGMKGSDCIINDIKIAVSRSKKTEFMEQLIYYMNKE